MNIVAPVMNDFNSIFINKMMTLANQRQQVLSNNIANANTPKYIRRDIDFKELLRRSLEGNNVKELSRSTGEIVEDKKQPPRLDGNNIKVANEMNAMMQNGLWYSLLAKTFTTRLNIMRSAIS